METELLLCLLCSSSGVEIIRLKNHPVIRYLVRTHHSRRLFSKMREKRSFSGNLNCYEDDCDRV